MGTEKLKPDFGVSHVFNRYTYFVHEYLAGRLNKNTARELTLEYEMLLNARYLIREHRFTEAISVLDRISTENSFVQAEVSFVYGYLFYQTEEFSHSYQAYLNSADYFEGLGIMGKALLSKFNVAENLSKLGRFNESYKIEKEIVQLGTEVREFNIVGLCLRSQGYRSMRQGNFNKGVESLKDSVYFLEKVCNESDSTLSFYYLQIAEIKNGKNLKDVLHDLDKNYSSTPNTRVAKFKSCLVSYCQGKDFSIISADCSPDIRQALSWLDDKLTVTKTKRSSNLSSRLIDFLKDKKEASLEECIEELWGFKGIEASLKQRLWTLVSRINKKRNIIVFNSNEKYQLI